MNATNVLMVVKVVVIATAAGMMAAMAQSSWILLMHKIMEVVK